jgi:hypothetical protein
VGLHAPHLYPQVMKLVSALTALVASALMVSCASTPQSRIAKSPDVYGSLPASQQEAVARGRITSGMSPQAVTLAWGRPSRVSRLNRGGQDMERWTYTSLAPIYHSSIGFGAGWGAHGHYGPYGRHCGGYDPFFAPQVDYVPVPTARVDFKNNRVSEFEIREH